VNKLLAAAVILAFFLLLSVGNSSYALDREPGFHLAQTSQESSAKDEEDFEDDEEFEDEVVEINDPFYAINYTFFNVNDILYVVITDLQFFYPGGIQNGYQQLFL
jgi:hypothetical protein